MKGKPCLEIPPEPDLDQIPPEGMGRVMKAKHPGDVPKYIWSFWKAELGIGWHQFSHHIGECRQKFYSYGWESISWEELCRSFAEELGWEIC